MSRSVPLALLSASSELIGATLGLHFPEERWPDLERGLASAAPELGQPDAQALAQWLRSASPSRSEIEILASHLTIGETYFFREKESFQFFEETIVPELLRSRVGKNRRIRIWSAGCCTGEEPYSIAMILDRIVPQRSGWNITILATDINPRFLRKAAEGLYSEWSFRAMPPGARERWFRKRSGRLWELEPRIRSRVTFSCVNLATDIFPALVNDTNAMDVIFCRNVLMYFSAERGAEIVQKFHQALAPGGWLLVNPAETSSSTFSAFQAVSHSGGTAYRKPGVGESRLSPASFLTPAVSQPSPHSFQASSPAPLELPRPNTFIRASAAAIRAAPEPSDALPEEDDPRELVARARRCANEGRLEEAARWCRLAIAAEKMNPAHHYLFSAVCREMGEMDRAAESLGRALYLDPEFVLAHFGLANIELARGRRGAATRHFSNALAALRTHEEEEILPESEGLTAGRLTEIIESLLASVPDDHPPERRSARP